MNEQQPIEQVQVKKKKPIAGILCIVFSFVVFFLTTFITIVLNIVSKANGGGNVNGTALGHIIVPLFQFFVPIVLIILGIVLICVTAASEK